jgi:hypothetical protein
MVVATHGNTVKNCVLLLNVVCFSSDEVSRSLENFLKMQPSSFVSTMSIICSRHVKIGFLTQGTRKIITSPS